MEDQAPRTEVATKEELLSHWSIQETLLQSYRGLFLSSQSIIFSVAALVVNSEKPNILSFLTLLIIGWVLLAYWVDICTARELDVSFCQMAILQFEKGEGPSAGFMTAFKGWQKISKEQKQQQLLHFQLAESQTRKKLSIHLPNIFKFLWVLTAVLLVLKHLG